jgi:hypothetical protein
MVSNSNIMIPSIILSLMIIGFAFISSYLLDFIFPILSVLPSIKEGKSNINPSKGSPYIPIKNIPISITLPVSKNR